MCENQLNFGRKTKDFLKFFMEMYSISKRGFGIVGWKIYKERPMKSGGNNFLVLKNLIYILDLNFVIAINFIKSWGAFI